jgi:hypothetical protein
LTIASVLALVQVTVQPLMAALPALTVTVPL